MSKKVLVIEDNEKNRLILKLVLKHHGYEVLEAVDGAEGIKKAKEHMPVLILMDLQMPTMDGLSAITALRGDAVTKDIKIIAVTSYAMKGDREKALQAGADEYITKPIDIHLLPVIIEGLLSYSPEERI